METRAAGVRLSAERSPGRVVAGALGLLAILSACSKPPAAACAPGTGSAAAVFTLYFGTLIPGGGEVTDTAWRSFVEATVTSNLPNGYTVLDAHGAWMNPATAQTITEPARVLVVALPQDPASLAAVNRVRRGYQLRFNQQVVGMTVQPACATF